MPVEPLITAMFGGVDLHVALSTGEKHDERLVDQSAVALAAHRVVRREAKAADDFNIVSGDARLFLELSQSTFQLRFTRIDMSLRQIPPVRMPH